MREEPVTHHASRITPHHSATVQHRALRGVVTMAGRELVIKLLALVGWVVLARLLDPAVFGIFAVANFSINVFSLLSELGLGAALIRGRTEPTRSQLDALFTFQGVVALGIAGVMFLGAPLVNGIYGGGDAEWVVRALAIAFVLISLRTVPAVVAQRKLRYGPMVLADVSGQASYWLVAMAAAVAGLGAWSVVWAVLASGVVGTLALYARMRLRPGLNFNWRPILPGALFSLKYQSQTGSSFAKYMMLPGLGGLIYGDTAVGYITWAHQLSVLPVQLAQLVSRVSYPAFSQLQHDKEELAHMVESTLKWVCRFSFPAFAVVGGLAPQIVQYIYTSKWSPALPSLYLLLLTTAVSVSSGVLLPALYSLGKDTAGLKIAVGWAAGSWLLAAALATTGMGVEALALGYLLATVVAMSATILSLREVGGLRLLRVLALPVVSGTVVAAALYEVGPLLVHDIFSLGVVGATGGLVSVGFNLWADRGIAFTAVKGLLKHEATQTDLLN